MLATLVIKAAGSDSTVKRSVTASQLRSAPAHSPVSSSAAVTPDQVAFLGYSTGEGRGGTRAVAFTVCAPSAANAWSIVAGEWRRITEKADDDSGKPTAESMTSSWLRDVAPQLSAPYRGSVDAEVATARLLQRTAMRVAVVVVDPALSDPLLLADARQRVLSECLSLHGRDRTFSGRSRCGLLIARSSVDGGTRSNRLTQAIGEQMTGLVWSHGMQLKFWDERLEPLPLELAHVIAKSVVRHVTAPKDADPVFDALLPKLSHVPSVLLSRSTSKRR